MPRFVMFVLACSFACKAEKLAGTTESRQAVATMTTTLPVDAAAPVSNATSLAGELSYVGAVVRLKAAPDVPLTMVNQGTAIWIRTYVAVDPIDVTKTFRMIDPLPSLRLIRDGDAAVFHWRELVDRERERALFHDRALLITWDTMSHRPTISAEYDCDETQRTCAAPDWVK